MNFFQLSAYQEELEFSCKAINWQNSTQNVYKKKNIVFKFLAKRIARVAGTSQFSLDVSKELCSISYTSIDLVINRLACMSLG